MNRIMPRLLAIVVCYLSIGAAYSADAPSRDPRNATAPARGALDLRLPDVRSIHAQLETEAAPPADAGEPQVVAVVVTPSAPDESSNTHLARTGIGSLYWAARHPAQAWRVLLPIVSGDDSAASEDVRFRCATFARPLSDRADCP